MTDYSIPNTHYSHLTKFLVTDLVPKGCIEDLEQMGFQVDHIEDLSNAELKRIIAEYTGIVVRTSLTLDKEMLDKAINLKYILRPGSGLDNINVEYADLKGIKIFNSPEANSDAVAEHAVGLLFGLLNNIPRANEQTREGKWIRQPNTGFLLKGKTVGIIGYGHTGSAFVHRLSGFEVQILVYDKYKKGFGSNYIIESNLEQIFDEAEVVSLHIPLTKETEYIINESFIDKMKKQFYLLNTSRGKNVDIKSVIKGLQSGKILGAGLDVLENENISTFTAEENHQLEELFKSGNVILTPHIAGWTHESRDNIFYFALNKFKKYLDEQKLLAK